VSEPRPRVLVAGVGNLFLGDDGFGCEVARRLAGERLPAGVEVVDYGIRGMHLAYDLLAGYDALVIVDALPHGAEPGSLHVLEVGPDDVGGQGAALDAHGMEPVAVLAGLGALGGALPRTFVVGCQPASTEERIGLSPVVAASVDAAAATVRSLLEDELAPSGAGSGSPGATGKEN
jgi:hydrogenase maturation protease